MKNWNVQKNQGMSLVELLVSVAVLGIAMFGIVGLMNLSTRYYSNSSKEVEVQQELQTTFAMVSNMIVDANESVSYDASSKKATIVNKTKKYIVQLGGRNLYAKEFDVAAAETDIKTSENLLADRVESFSLDTSHYDDGYITLAMSVKYGTRTAAMTKNVFMRNAGKEVKDFFGQCDPSVAADAGDAAKIIFTIKQNTASSIANGTKMVVKLKMGTSGTISSVTGTGFAIGSYHYNRVTGEVTVHVTVSGAWADGAAKEIKVKSSGSVNVDDCRVLSIGK